MVYSVCNVTTPGTRIKKHQRYENRDLAHVAFSACDHVIQLFQDPKLCVYVTCIKLTLVLLPIVWLKCPELHARYLSNA